MRNPFARRPAAIPEAKGQVETAMTSAIGSHSEMFDDEDDFAEDIERSTMSSALLAALRDVLNMQWAENHPEMPVVQRARDAVERAERAGIR